MPASLPDPYRDMISSAVDTEPFHTVWRASDLPQLTLDQITLVRDARRHEFTDKFADADWDGSGLLDALMAPSPLVLQARVLAALEWAARQVLFEDAVEEAGRREYEANDDGFGDRSDAAYEESRS